MFLPFGDAQLCRRHDTHDRVDAFTKSPRKRCTRREPARLPLLRELHDWKPGGNAVQHTTETEFEPLVACLRCVRIDTLVENAEDPNEHAGLVEPFPPVTNARLDISLV